MRRTRKLCVGLCVAMLIAIAPVSGVSAQASADATIADVMRTLSVSAERGTLVDSFTHMQNALRTKDEWGGQIFADLVPLLLRSPQVVRDAKILLGEVEKRPKGTSVEDTLQERISILSVRAADILFLSDSVSIRMRRWANDYAWKHDDCVKARPGCAERLGEANTIVEVVTVELYRHLAILKGAEALRNRYVRIP